MGNNKKETEKIKKAKPKCCGKFRKKSKHCSRCPLIFREQCKLETEKSKKDKKEEGKKKVKKKTDKKKTRKKKKNK